MKKGFALLETLIVVTFLAVSLLMLYQTFNSMVTTSKKNILYDDAATIYDVYFLKEYLFQSGLSNILDNSDIKELKCNDLPNSGCEKIIKKLNINKIYLTKYNLTNVNLDNYSSSLINYIDTLKIKDNSKYRLIVEIEDNDNLKYTSIDISEETI